MSLDNFPNNVQISGERFELRVDKDLTPTTVAGGAEITLLTVSGVAGKIDSFWFSAENDKHEIIIILDGVEQERFKPKDYNDIFVTDDIAKKGGSIYSDNKITKITFSQPCDFANSVEVRFKNTDGGAKDLVAYRLEYREKVII